MPFTDREHVTAVVFYVALAIFVYLVFLMVQPFFVPLGWAAVLVIVFHPIHARFEARYGPTRAAALSTATIAVIVVAPLILITTAFVREAVQATGAHDDEVHDEEPVAGGAHALSEDRADS